MVYFWTVPLIHLPSIRPAPHSLSNYDFTSGIHPPTLFFYKTVLDSAAPLNFNIIKKIRLFISKKKDC